MIAAVNIIISLLHTLFKEPTKLYVVTVVVDRNHNEQKLMRKPHMAESPAASWNLGSCRAGSARNVRHSPVPRATRHSSGYDSRLL